MHVESHPKPSSSSSCFNESFMREVRQAYDGIDSPSERRVVYARLVQQHDIRVDKPILAICNVLGDDQVAKLLKSDQ